MKIKTESIIEKDNVKDQKCDMCKTEYLTDSEYKKHLTSMVHQFKLGRQNPEVKVHYVIPEANQGYQMMLKSGKVIYRTCAINHRTCAINHRGFCLKLSFWP